MLSFSAASDIRNLILGVRDTRISKEMLNIIERYMITISELDPDVTDASNKMTDECREKRIPSSIVDACVAILMGSRRVGRLSDPYSMVSVAATRIDAMRKISPDATNKVIQKYASILAGSQHWGIVQSVADALYATGVRIEGFASPLNSKFFGKPDAVFCSLFPETDAPFGSIGNFFTTDLTKYPGDMTVNPPFANKLMLAAAKKVIETLEICKKTAYFFLPDWFECPAITLLVESKFYVKSLKSPRLDFRVDYGKSEGPGSFFAMFIVLSSEDRVISEEKGTKYFDAVSIK